MTLDELHFHSRSPDAPAPGAGCRERIADPAAYVALADRSGWRRVLSNFHKCEACSGFAFGGQRYGTVEHAFQASKIALVDPKRALEFTLDSGTELGAGGGAIAQASRKLVRLDRQQLALWDVIKDAVMEQAQEAKFSQCPHAREVLLATGEARLYHIVPRRAASVRFHGLERVRARLLRDSELK